VGIVVFAISQNGRVNLAGILVIDPLPCPQPSPTARLVSQLNHSNSRALEGELAVVKQALATSRVANTALQRELSGRPNVASVVNCQNALATSREANTALQRDLGERPTMANLVACRNALEQSLPKPAVADALGLSPESRDLLRHIRHAASEARSVAKFKDNFSYYLLRLELTIPLYGEFINTEVQDPERQPVYKILQQALQAVGFYSGALDGDQRSTHKALSNFQNNYNARVPKAQRLNPVGTFGYRTLETLRRHYRRQRS